jgi:hypothetical protein
VRARGYGFMKRIKARWDEEFSNKRNLSKQNLRDNAARFKKEPREYQALPSGNIEQCVVEVIPVSKANNRSTWSNDMKLKLVMMDKEEREKGLGFMKRVKDRWDEEFPEYSEITAQSLRDNAARFKSDIMIKNLMLVNSTVERTLDSTEHVTTNEIEQENQPRSENEQDQRERSQEDGEHNNDHTLREEFY